MEHVELMNLTCKIWEKRKFNWEADKGFTGAPALTGALLIAISVEFVMAQPRRKNLERLATAKTAWSLAMVSNDFRCSDLNAKLWRGSSTYRKRYRHAGALGADHSTDSYGLATHRVGSSYGSTFVGGCCTEWIKLRWHWGRCSEEGRWSLLATVVDWGRIAEGT